MDSLLESEQKLIGNDDLIDIERNYNELEIIMLIYKKALEDMLQKFTSLKQIINEYYDYSVIADVNGRVKNLDSIVGKMKKKKIDFNYENMIENINDIAGVRIVCNYKDDIYRIRNIIREQKDIKILKEKNYIKKAKKSGYSAYHIIVEAPVKIKEEIIYVKVEIQIRTILMDFWATTEHKVKYKPKKKLSKIDSIKLFMYARVMNLISDKMMKLHRKVIY